MSKNKGPVYNKSFKFALNIIELYKKLIEQKEFVISKQLLRSGTSIGANVVEASAGVHTTAPTSWSYSLPGRNMEIDVL